jgi:hypothetical protein
MNKRRLIGSAILGMAILFACGSSNIETAFLDSLLNTGGVSSPTIALTSVTPNYARQGSTVTLAGSLFETGMTIRIGSTACTSSTVVSSTSATCVVPSLAKPELLDITVTNPDASTATLASNFTHLGNPTLWLRADAITGFADNAALTTWTDSSTSGFNAAPSAVANRPTYRLDEVNGLPTVYFDGVDDHVHLGANYIYSASGGIALIAVMNSVTDRAIPLFYDFGQIGSANYGFGYDLNTMGVFTPVGAFGGVQTTAAHAQGNAYVIFSGEIVFSSEQRVRINGSGAPTTAAITTAQLTNPEIDQSPTRAAGAGPVTIGQQSKTTLQAGRNLNGNIAELFVIIGGLTSTQRERVECYLSQKYNIAIAHGC